MPTKEGLLVGILLVKPGDKETCAKLESRESLRKYFDEDFPMFTDFVTDEDLELMAKRPLSTLPTFAYCGAALCTGESRRMELERGGWRRVPPRRQHPHRQAVLWPGRQQRL